MSAVALVEAAYPPEVLAEELDYDFQDIADRMPTEAKFAPSGAVTILHEAPGIGVLQAMYIGGFMMRITALAEGYDDQLGFYKEYNLRDYQDAPGGVLHAVSNTQPEDFDGCPAPLATLACLIKTLRNGYLESVDPDAVLADVILLPTGHVTGTLE